MKQERGLRHDDLSVQAALVVFDLQEQVCALLSGEFSRLLGIARSWDSPVSKEVWAISSPSSLV